MKFVHFYVNGVKFGCDYDKAVEYAKAHNAKVIYHWVNI